ncbi:MAG: polysaccharide deacetylase family protein [Gemmataceae bacterium]|nr:polysaccharide deacetylase family protein [Gemmataceae bacterium]
MNILSFDVEEYYHVHAFADVIHPAQWDMLPSRVVDSTHRVLDIIGGTRATFFVLGDVARRNPHLVREIASAGHEIASHGFGHQRVDRMPAGAFRHDIRRAKRLIEDLAGCAVTAYRAPSFSITRDTPWAHEILVEEGYTLDSSTAAGRRGRSLEPVQSGPYVIETPSGPLTEVPLPAVAGLPVGGGGYLRLLPYWMTRAALRSLDQPFCVYLHPWEFDPEQPRVAAPLRQTIRHRVGLRTTAGKLRHLLRDFPFTSMADALGKSIPVAVAA